MNTRTTMTDEGLRGLLENNLIYLKECRRRIIKGIAQCDELRAVLAPLLDDPPERWDDAAKAMRCRLCGGTNVNEPDDYHRLDCPSRPDRRDELLGRVDRTADQS